MHAGIFQTWVEEQQHGNLTTTELICQAINSFITKSAVAKVQAFKASRI